MSFDLAIHIRQLREELGWTQEDLAKRARIDQGDLSRIERGGIDPRWSTVNRIINALGETFSLTSAPTTIGPALTSETRENLRRTARSDATKRRTLGEAALPIKR